MSLGVAFKGPEGIVLAADSRVTLHARRQEPDGVVIRDAAFDNATKLLRVQCQNHVGVVTYGLGAFGQSEPRTPHSYLPEFEQSLKDEGLLEKRLAVVEFAARLGGFFRDQWKETMPEDHAGGDMVFLVAGYDEGEPYGKVFKLGIPSLPEPEEQNRGAFGVTWGGQLEFTSRLIHGWDPRLPSLVQRNLGLSDERLAELMRELAAELAISIPYPFLPLQDCVDLSIFMIRMTMELQTWTTGLRGVGGAIDVATVTRVNGFEAVQQKQILGERDDARWGRR